MSLTDEASNERKWRNYPVLSILVSQGQLGLNWTGISSGSDNLFERISRLLDIQARTQDRSIDLRRIIRSDQPGSSEVSLALRHELDGLICELRSTADVFCSMAEEIEGIVRR